MVTLYWISVLGNISTLASVTFTIFAIFLFCLSLNVFAKPTKKAIKLCYIGIVASLALCVLVPSKNELYAIYGVGSVIDYAKNSKEVQKLPDNAVKALNVYLESVQKKDSTDNKEK